MKAKELRDLTVEELKTKGEDLYEELFRLKFQHGVRPLENTAKLSLVKRDIARIKTVMSEKQQ